MRELLMLRHGETEHNERRLFTGATDVPLSANGRARVAALSGTCPPANRFFTSGMRRADETLALLYGDVERTAIPALAEYCFGVYEGRSHDDLYASEPLYRDWLAHGDDGPALPGGESRAAFGARVREGWQTLVGQKWQGLAVLVSHGGVLSRLNALLRLTDEESPRLSNVCGWRVTLLADGGIARCEKYP